MSVAKACRRVLGGWIGSVSVLLLAACSGGANHAPTSGAATNTSSPGASTAELRILAGSELKELEPDILRAAHAAGVNLSLSYAGTLEMVDRVNAGES